MNNKFLKAGLFSLFVTTSAQALSQTNDSDTNELYETVKTKPGRDALLGFDCDHLDQGKITPNFIKHLGDPDHMAHVDSSLRIKRNVTEKDAGKAYFNHLAVHYDVQSLGKALTNGIQRCRTEFPEQSGLEKTIEP